ncbi:MAG: 2-hydroxyglutaryl-CoA dehydratase [Anaerolineales bacterium]|nr:2-hydroxyglutaryl-CoA dehydratase [Anaerolineales bacterium]
MALIRALGIDVGSTTAKIVGTDEFGNLSWHLLEQADPRVESQVEWFLFRAKEVAPSLSWDATGRAEGVPLVATGYGRRLVHQATRQVTEITCHAKGIYRELSHGGTLVDIGGQDSKVIVISRDGDVIDFTMNDKCAAGTGRFLENTASRLGVPVEQLGEVTLAAKDEVSISSTCTVFAESEVVSLIAHGVELGPILKGLHRSLIKRIVAMIGTVGLKVPLMLSGGVVLNTAVSRMLKEETGEEVIMPRHPQLMGAYGASLIALELAGL